METIGAEKLKQESVHWVLSHIYTAYFLLFLLGILLDVLFRFEIIAMPIMRGVGAAFIALGSIVVVWAEKAGRDFKTLKLSGVQITSEHFCRGPYCYTRIPTEWGLFLLVLGFGFFTNALFVILTTIISFLISQLLFKGKHDRILEHKYGSPYLEYKKRTKF